MSSVLRTWGWLTWEGARDLLAGASAAWLASERFVPCALLPEDMPRTQRIHAWTGMESTGPLWRLIPDGGRGLVLVTGLLPDAGAGYATEGLPAFQEKPVTFDVTKGRQWQEYRVMGVAPIVFLRPMEVAVA